jgi:SAM-dependent methyltransferase
VAVDRSRAEAFGEDAERYDRGRPTYPDELVRDLLVAKPRAVLDVGCGTGIASRCFEGEGRFLLGVEPDARMGALARDHGLDVEIARFEDWDPRGRRFDLLISGQAWHWVDPAVGAAKAAEVIRPGGRFAAFWNHAVHVAEVAEVMLKVYSRQAPELLEGRSVVLGGVRPRTALGTEASAGSVVDPDAAALGSAEAFGEIARRSYGWSCRYTAESWLDQLPTHSDHRFLDEGVRQELFDELRSELRTLGPAFTVCYQTRLLTAVRAFDGVSPDRGGSSDVA